MLQTRNKLGLLLLLALLAIAGSSCVPYDSPPRATIVGLNNGLLTDPQAPIVVQFHEAILLDTLSIKILVKETDAEGRLYDEDDNEDTEPTILYERLGPEKFEEKGTASLDAARRTLSINVTDALPVGASLVLVIEPGLSDDAGTIWNVRQHLEFGYEFQCDGELAPTTFPTGYYFMQVDVVKPISTQILLWCDIRVDEASGTFVGQFTNADRDPTIDCTQFGLSCKDTEVCRTIPAPACVAPSDTASTTEEYPDYYANNVLPEGYSFTVNGCVVDQEDGSFTFANEPASLQVQSPPVGVEGIVLNSAWAYDSEGVLRGGGTFQASQVSLGTTPSGPGVGSHTERFVPAEEAPEGIPAPPAK
jgi:hypothetical protein